MSRAQTKVATIVVALHMPLLACCHSFVKIEGNVTETVNISSSASSRSIQGELPIENAEVSLDLHFPTGVGLTWEPRTINRQTRPDGSYAIWGSTSVFQRSFRLVIRKKGYKTLTVVRRLSGPFNTIDFVLIRDDEVPTKSSTR